MEMFCLQPMDKDEEEDRKKLLERLEKERAILELLDEVKTFLIYSFNWKTFHVS